MVPGYQYLKDCVDIDKDFTANDIYTLHQIHCSFALSEDIILMSNSGNRWQWTTGAFGFYQWLNTEAPVIFKEAVMWMLNQMFGSVIPSQIQLEIGPSMSINILPSLGIISRAMPIGGSFDTPLLNGALFHQSTFRDLFGLKGVSFTAGLRLDYERMNMDYNSGTSLEYKVGF